MWILTPSITSAFAAATGELTSASSEQLAAAFARSLLSRSKPSPQRTWLQRLKRDSWTTHLSGAISSDSLGESFTDWWTSSLAATRANPSAQPANASEPKTHDTSGLTYQPELLQCDQQSAFLRMSKDTFLSGCATCCKTWQDWVTERRGAWRQRVNAARLTRGSGSSSWPTISVNESKNSVGKSQLDRNSIPLGTMAAWTTPTPWQQEESLDSWETRKAKNKAKGYNGNGQGTPLDMQVKILGQAAPASGSSLGSRQGLWLTPRANEPDSDPNFAARNADRGAHCHGTLSSQAKETWWTPQVQDSKHSGTNPTANGERDLLVNQVNWATPQLQDGHNIVQDSTSHKTIPAQLTEMNASGKLNPRWVETLMGLPIGWTMPSCIRPVTTAPTSCDSSATALCQPPQSERSDFLLASCGKEPTK
jgi:hypothetical protein